ncbi:MAG: hypothetical protein ABIJ22_00500 [Patescibacteria group bacterium]
MRLILVLGLLLVGVLEIPLFYDLEINQINNGEVKGEEVKLQNPVVQNGFPSPPSPSFPFPSPLPLSPLPLSPPPSLIPASPQPLQAIFSKTTLKTTLKTTPEITPETTPEIFLLNKKTKLKDEELKLNFPNLDSNQSWLLYIEYNLISVEDLLGFDDPGFTVYIDDQLAYQQSAFETGTKIISFNPKFFSNQPQTLTIWSGNSGDELKNTYAVINSIKLISQSTRSIIETEPINDLVITVDSAEYLTLEWIAPQTDGQNLNRVLAYDIRYSSNLITQENWSQAQLAEIFLPQDFSPQSPGIEEIILIKAPLIDFGYITIRSIDSSGQISPLGTSVLFNSSI